MKKTNKPKSLKITPRDFSDRKHFPGTDQHLFHTIKKVDELFKSIPLVVFLLLFPAIRLLLTRDLVNTLIFSGFIALDWFVLFLLPKLKVSFGPPELTTLILAMVRFGFSFLPHPIMTIIQVVGTILVVIGFFIEPQNPIVEKYHLILPTPKQKTNTVRIIHISDLHLEFTTRTTAKIIRMINQQKPDLILFSGDYFNLSYHKNPETIQQTAAFFNQLEAKIGIFGVTGSPSVDLEASVAAMRPLTKLSLINDQVIPLSYKGIQLNLIGLYCTHHPDKDLQRLKSLDFSRSSEANILLYHSPDIAPAISSIEPKIDLQLSGHTHGGQVCLPLMGPLFTSSLYGLKFKSGFYFINEKNYLIISRGLGLEGDAAPRVRFLSPPEIGVVTLEFPSYHVK